MHGKRPASCTEFKRLLEGVEKVQTTESSKLDLH